MGNKLKAYVDSLRCLLESEEKIEDIEAAKRELLTEIEFWQHERLIHLLVTILFALLTMTVIVLIIFYQSIPVFLLGILLIALLVPYIRHYYILENGVQTLYTIYEDLCRRQKDSGVPGAFIPEQKGIELQPLKKKDK